MVGYNFTRRGGRGTEINVLDFLENSFFVSPTKNNRARERMERGEERGGKGMNGSREKSFFGKFKKCQ